MVFGFTAGKSKLNTEYNTSSAISVLFRIRFQIEFNIKSAVCSTPEIQTAHVLNSIHLYYSDQWMTSVEMQRDCVTEDRKLVWCGLSDRGGSGRSFSNLLVKPLKLRGQESVQNVISVSHKTSIVAKRWYIFTAFISYLLL